MRLSSPLVSCSGDPTSKTIFSFLSVRVLFLFEIDVPRIFRTNRDLFCFYRNGLVDPTGRSPGVIQIPQRITTFQGKVFRDLKLGDDYAGKQGTFTLNLTVHGVCDTGNIIDRNYISN